MSFWRRLPEKSSSPFESGPGSSPTSPHSGPHSGSQGSDFRGPRDFAEEKEESRSKRITLWVMFISILSIGGVVWVAKRPHPLQDQQAGTQSQWQVIAPRNPSTSAPGGHPLPLQRSVPTAQQDLNPADVTTTVEVETDPLIPAFRPGRITVKSNEIVQLIFRNRSKIDHYDNFVLVHSGEENDVGEAGLEVGPDAGYLPIRPEQIIAHTKTIGPGKSDTIIFRAPPEPGLYPFISTVPRRWEAMHGILEVK